MRCKGRFTGMDKMEYMVQGVDEVFEIREIQADNKDKKVKLLFIGKGIKEEWLRDKVHKMLIST